VNVNVNVKQESLANTKGKSATALVY